MNGDLSPCKILEICLRSVGPFDATLGVPLVEAGRYLVEATREGIEFTSCHPLVYSILERICKTYFEEHRLALWGIKKRLVRELGKVISDLFSTAYGDFLVKRFSEALVASGMQGYVSLEAVANLPWVDSRLLTTLLKLSKEAPPNGDIQMLVLHALGKTSLPPHDLISHVLDIPLRAGKTDVLVELLRQEENQETLSSWLTAGVSSKDEAQTAFLGRVLGRSAVYNPRIMQIVIQQYKDMPHGFLDVPSEFLMEWLDGVKAEATRLREREEERLSPDVLEVLLDMLQDEDTASLAHQVFTALQIQPEELPRHMLERLHPATALFPKVPKLGKSEVAVRGRWEVTIDAIYETLNLAEAIYSSLQPIIPVLKRLSETKIVLLGTPELLRIALDGLYGGMWNSYFEAVRLSEQVLEQFEERIFRYRGLLSRAMEKAQSENREEAVQHHLQEIARCDRILEERKRYGKDKVLSPYFAWELLSFADNFWSQAVDEFAELYSEDLFASDEAEVRVEACRAIINQFKDLLNAEAEAVGFPSSPLGLRGAAVFLKAATNPSLRAKVREYVEKARTILAGCADSDEISVPLLEAASSRRDDSIPLMDSPRLKALESLVKLAEGNPPLCARVRELLIDALEEIESLESPLGADNRLAASLFADLGRLGIDYPSAKRITDTPGLGALISFCVERYRVPLHEIRVVDQRAAQLMQRVLPLSVKSLVDILLHSQDPAKRAWAAESLGEMSNLETEAIIALIKTIHSGDTFVRMKAAKSLHRQIVESRSSFSAPELEAIGFGLKALIESRTPGVVLQPSTTISAFGAYGYAFDTLWEINARLKNKGYFHRKREKPKSRLAVAPLLEVLAGWLGFLGLGRLLAGKFSSGFTFLVLWGMFDILLCLWGYAILRNRWFLCATPLIGAIWFLTPLVSAFFLRKAIDLELKCFEPLRHFARRRATAV